MTDLFGTWLRKTSRATPSAISLPALADGPTPPALPDGPMIAHSGLDRAPASRFPSPGRARARKTSATCGPSSSASLQPVGPMSSWENRLRQRLARIGSTECLLTWKASVTPAGRSLFRLVPSMRPIEEIASGLWPTPTAVDRVRNEETMAKCAAFRKRNAGQNTVPLYLGEVAERTALWPTPNQRDYKGAPGAACQARGGHQSSLPAVTKAMWPTPVKSDGTGGPRPPDAKRGPMPGLKAAAAGMWPTPCSSDDRDRGRWEDPAIQRRVTMGKQVMLSMLAQGSGPSIDGPSEQTEKRGALNPQFVSWLMGFPPEWDACAPTATPSSRKSRQKS